MLTEVQSRILRCVLHQEFYLSQEYTT